MEPINHYKWLDTHLDEFWMAVFGENLKDTLCAGIVSAHGDKGYQYKNKWKNAGIPFPHGMALFMLTYTDKMDRPKYESCQWVIDNYNRYVDLLPEIDENDQDVVCPFAKSALDDKNDEE